MVVVDDEDSGVSIGALKTGGVVVVVKTEIASVSADCRVKEGVESKSGKMKIRI